MTNDDEPQGLSFRPKLFAGASQKKTVPTPELYKQLKKLSKELNGLQQETVDTQSLDAVTKQLLAPALLKHSEQGVVAYVTCCIADILRLYAPEAPYNDDEVRLVFNVFIDQLQLLSDDSNQFFALREYLLTSLATVRTPALIALLPGAEDIISRFFTVLFGVVAPGQPHNIYLQVLDILRQLIEERKSVPQDVVDVILLQFTKRRQQDNSAAHQLAGDLATGTSDILQRYIYQYFNDVIVNAAQQRSEQQRGEGDGAANSSLDDLRSAHYLILELNKAAPGTLLNVIPQLEEELSVEDVDIRVLSTGVLGEMFAEKGFMLAKRYESTWKTWKGRRADASSLVRIQWVEHAVSLYQHQPQLSRELGEHIVEKLKDVDERVRQAACHSLGLLELSTAVQNAIGHDVIEALGERCKDRKAAVRSEAIIALATLYSQVLGALEKGDATARERWGGIPSKIFVLRYINDPDIDSKVESILTGAILNFAKIKDDRAKCARLLLVFDSLTTKARNGFFSYMRRQQEVIRLTDVFLRLCEGQGESDGGSEDGTEQRLRQLIIKISARFPDKVKMENALSQLASLRDAEVCKGLRATMDPNNDIKAVRKWQKSSLKRLSSLAPNLLDTTAPLWKCVGLTTINRVLVPFLIEHASATGTAAATHGEPQFHHAADTLLTYIANVFPEMLRLCSDELFVVSELRSRDIAATEERLALMVRFAKAIPKAVPSTEDLKNQLAEFVRSGNLRQAKYAAFLITQIPGAAELCAALTSDVVDNLDNRHIERRAPSVAALARFAQYAPAAYATYSDRISQIIAQGILSGEQTGSGTEGDSEWQPREDLEDAELTRIYAVKVLSNWLVGAERPTREAVQTVVGTLRRLVRGGGGRDRSRTAADQHVLLVAASGMLKIAARAQLDRLLSAADVQSLAMVVQDPCYEVRSTFLQKKLIPLLVSHRIHARFIPLLFLVEFEVEESVRKNVEHVVEQRLAQLRPTPGSPSAVEDSLCRFLHMLAHHPDWDDTQPVATLDLFARYIEFYIGCVCVAQNVSLLFCYAGELKAYRNRAVPDGVNHNIGNDTFTNRLYVLSELAQYLLREKSMSANWPVNVYPGKLSLPEELFEPLSDVDKSEIPRKSFLDPEFVAQRAKSSGASRQ
ncbi:Sister chromatid cohesion protein pds5, partial [Coemansia guatemalensis]